MVEIVRINNRGDFKIFEQGVEVSQVILRSHSKKEANCHYNGVDIALKHPNIFKNISIYKNDIKSGTIATNWTGQRLKIEYVNDIGATNETCYLRVKGNRKYILETEDKKEILRIETPYNWSRLRSDYKLTYWDASLDSSLLVELLIYAGFGIKMLHLVANGM